MKAFVVAFLVLSGAGATTDLFACGAKFLMANRGTRFGKVAAARHPAAVLVYANPDSTLPQALSKVKVEQVLGRAGYRPTTVSTPSELEQALRQGGWDLVLADLADGDTLRPQLRGENSPVFIPVMFKPSKNDFKQAEQDFGVVVKGPVKSQRFLRAIDEVVSLLVASREEADENA